MQQLFTQCQAELEQRRYQTAITHLRDLIRQAKTPQEMIIAARAAGLALYPGIERRLLRRAVKQADCPPEGLRRLASYYASHGPLLLVDELLEPALAQAHWPADERSYAHAVWAMALASRHRYRSAAEQLDHAARIEAETGQAPPESPELAFARLSIPYWAGQWEQVEQGLLALTAHPDCGPAVYLLIARCQEHLGRLDEALATMRTAGERYPDYPAIPRVEGGLCWSLGRESEALAALDRLDALLPYPRHRRRTAELRAIIARQVVRLDVPVVRQGRNHCFPACLAMVKGHFGRPEDQRAIGTAVMDGVRGTPLYRAIRHLEEEGWVVRAFRASVANVKELIDRGVPPILGLEYSGGAHVQVCVGYDNAGARLYLQDPGSPYPAWVTFQDFETVYAQSDFWALAFAPAPQAEALAALPAVDDQMIRAAQRLWESLRADDQAGAAAAMAAVAALASPPGIHLLALRAWPRVGDRDSALAAAEALLDTFPDHQQIRTEVARHLSRLGEWRRGADVARAMTGSRPANAWLLMAEAAERADSPPDEVARLYRRAVLADSHNAQTLAEWGRSEQRAGRLDAARRLFLAASEIEPLPAYAADLAALAADEGRLDEALAGYRAVLKQEPFYPWVWWRRGEIHWSRGRLRSAVRAMRVAVAQAPEDAHFALRLAEALVEANQAEKAATLLAGHPELERTPDLLNRLGVVLINLGRPAEAIAPGRRGRERFPGDPRFAALTAEALRRTDRPEEGLALLQEAVAARPDDAYLQGRLGQHLLMQGEIGAGIAAITESRRLSPTWQVPLEWAESHADDHPDPVLLRFLSDQAAADGEQGLPLAWRLARLWLRVDRAVALQEATAALDREGRTADAITTFGRIAHDAGATDRAAAAFHEALRLQPDHPRATFSLARLARESGDMAEAERLGRAAALAATDPDLARRCADQYLEDLEARQAWDEGIAFLALIEGRVSEPRRLTYEGYLLDRLGSHTDAFALYDQAIALEPNQPWAYFRRAACLLDLEQPEQALAAAQAAADRFPHDVGVQWIRGRAHEVQEQLTEARAAYEVALAIDPDWAPVRRAVYRTHAEKGWWVLAAKAESAPRPARAGLLAEWAEALAESDRPADAVSLATKAVELDPTILPALRIVAADALERKEFDRVIALLDRVIEERRVPPSFPDLVNLHLTAALGRNRPRRPHWREQARARIGYLLDDGWALAPETLSLRRMLALLESEAGNLRAALAAGMVRDQLFNLVVVPVHSLITRLLRPPVDQRPGEEIRPLPHCPPGLVQFRATEGSAIYQAFVRLLDQVAAVGRSFPYTVIIAGMLLWTVHPGLGITAYLPLILDGQFKRLPGVKLFRA